MPLSLFLLLILKILPLYLVIALGFLAGKFLNVNKESIARLLIYIISPAVIFHSVLTTELSLSVLSLPLLFFLCGCSLALFTLAIARHFWHDSTKNLLAFTAGTGNTGYFGLPVAIALFGPGISGLVVIANLGLVLYENTLGFFITARGHHTVKASIVRVLKLPTIYAFLAAVLFNSLSVNLGTAYTELAVLFRGAYTILGMMLIGLALASIKNFKLDIKFLSFAFLIKFLLWPVLILLLITLDSSFTNFFSESIYKIMILLSIAPLAANTVSFATELNAHPEKASFAVLMSTLFALFYIPVFAVFFLM